MTCNFSLQLLTHPCKVLFVTAKQFAIKMKRDYRTILSWCDKGLVPGARRITSVVGEYWDIPVEALTMEPPKPGPKVKFEVEQICK